MFLKRTGIPEDGEIVFCTVIKVQYHAVTVELDEYPGIQGLIHISEVSPGRIRNINDYVQEGKKIICKIIRIDHERGHIDLSLRRVNESQKRKKADEMKQELKAEKIISFLAEKLKQPAETLYTEISTPIFQSYHLIFQAFEDVVEKGVSLESLGVKKELADKLEETIKDKVKPKEIEIITKVTLKSYEEDGLEIIKQAFAKAKGAEIFEVRYLGGGSFRISITAKDYKKAESVLSRIEDAMTSVIKKKGEISFERQ